MRRGTLESLMSKPELLSDRFLDMIRFFRPGDVVESAITPGLSYGVVKDVNEKTRTIMVIWNSGAWEQVSQDEIQIVPNIRPEIEERIREQSSQLNTPRMAAIDAVVPQDFISDPKLHGIEESRGGGFSIMQNLQKDLHKESLEDVTKASEKPLRSRRAVYHKERGRIYQRSKSESETGSLICPRCGASGMEKQPFTKGVGIYVCPSCGWKITTDKIL